MLSIAELKFYQNWAFAHTVRKLRNLRWALRLFSGLCNLHCAFSKHFAFAQFSL